MNPIRFFRARRHPSKHRRRGAGHPHQRRRPPGLEFLEGRCLWSYSITDLGTLGTTSYGEALNDSGQAAVSSELPCNCILEPALWAGGVLHDLGSLAGTGGHALSINNLGQVAGESNSHAFLWSRECGMRDLGFIGVANKVNDRGEVVGVMGAPVQDAFLWKDGQVVDLSTFGLLPSSVATDINNQGEVVGQGSVGVGLHAFLWSREGGITDLGTLDGNPGSTSGAEAINDRGQIVGESYSHDFGTTHAAYFSPSGPVDLGTLGFYSYAEGVNNAGQVVGYSAGGPFLTDLQGGPMVNLNAQIPPDSGWTLFDARRINDAGQIVGSGFLNDQIRPYLLTPEESVPPALITAVGEGGAIPAVASKTQLPASSPLGFVPPQAGEVRGGARPACQEGTVPRTVSVLRRLAAQGTQAEGWSDPLTDLPAS